MKQMILGFLAVSTLAIGQNVMAADKCSVLFLGGIWDLYADNALKESLSNGAKLAGYKVAFGKDYSRKFYPDVIITFTGISALSHGGIKGYNIDKEVYPFLENTPVTSVESSVMGAHTKALDLLGECN